MGFHMAYSFSQCSDETKYSCSLARAFTALTHAQNGRTYGIFHQSMLKRVGAFVPSSQSLHCSRTCTKWAFIRHILSANAQTRLSIPAVLPEPSLHSHMLNLGIHTAYFISQCSDAPEHSYRLARAFTALAHTLNIH